MARGRIEVADALRAFALLGIAVAHSSNEYLGIPPFDYSNRFSDWEKSLGPWIDLLVIGKFFTIFSFLFGLSFQLQLEGALRGGKEFVGRYLWRLAILFVFGFVHTLLFAGDILIVYAVAGLVLPLAARMSNRALGIVGVLLVLNLPVELNRLRMHVVPVTTGELGEERQLMREVDRHAHEDFRIKQSGTLGELVGWNLRTAFVWKALFQLFSGRIFVTVGLFLLGVLAGRVRLYEDSERQRRWLWRALWASLPVGALTTVLTQRWNPTLLGSPHEVHACLGLVSFDVQQIALSVAYMAGFVMVSRRYAGSWMIESLQRAGRMGLTIYLSMSVGGMLVFCNFGLGLVGKCGMFGAIGIGVVSVVVLFAAANWWMRRFRFGPVEWLWRCGTNLRLEAM